MLSICPLVLLGTNGPKNPVCPRIKVNLNLETGKSAIICPGIEVNYDKVFICQGFKQERNALESKVSVNGDKRTYQ